MPSFQRFSVSIYVVRKNNALTQGKPTITKEILISEKKMCIERMPYNKVFQILGTQANASATYCLYLELNDPNIPQEAVVEWEMYDKKYSGKVKFTQPYSQVVMNRKGEAYIQSDNE